MLPGFLQTSFSSGRFNNGQPELMVSHSSGALGISTPALTRSVRPDSLVSMVNDALTISAFPLSEEVSNDVRVLLSKVTRLL